MTAPRNFRKAQVLSRAGSGALPVIAAACATAAYPTTRRAQVLRDAVASLFRAPVGNRGFDRGILVAPMRRGIFLAVGVALSALMLVLSFRRVELGEVAREISRVNPWVFIVFPALQVANFCIPAARSQLLFAPVHRFSFARLLRSVVLAFAVNNVIPFRAGELVRMAYLSKHGQIPATTCLAVVVLERILDLVGLLLLLAVTIPAMAVRLPVGQSFVLFAVVTACAIGGAVAASRYPARFVAASRSLASLFGSTARRVVGARAATFADGLAALRSLRSLLAVCALTAAFWLVAAVWFRLWIWAFGFSLPWYAPVVLIAAISLGMAVPSTPGSIGVYHWFAIQALVLVGVAQSAAASFAVVVHAVTLVPFMITVTPFLFRDYLELRAGLGAVDGTDTGRPNG